MAKEKLRYEQVYTRRNVRDPINKDIIEEVRNEGWEFIGTIGTPAESAKNPTVAPLLAVFRKTEMLTSPGADEEIARLKKEIEILKTRNEKPEKAPVKPKISKTTPRVKSRFAVAAEKGMS